MTFSVLMYALMGASLAAVVATLVVDAVRGRRPEPSLRRVARPTLRSGHGRLIHRWDCPQTLRQPTSPPAHVPRDRTPRSCKR
jgi:hypothetical protein